MPLWVGTIIATAAAVLFVIFWPRPQEELEEEEPDAANQKQEGK